jgi:hypothetical protein
VSEPTNAEHAFTLDTRFVDEAQQYPELQQQQGIGGMYVTT